MTDKEIEVIIKPIFTKMFKANFSACEYGIECYKKGMEYQGIKEPAIENDNLIKQVRIFKEQIEKMKCALKEIIKTVQNDNISGYGDRLVKIYDISCEVLQEITEK